MKNNKYNKGFTLIELLVVLSILAIFGMVIGILGIGVYEFILHKG